MDSSQLKIIGSDLETTVSSYEKVLLELQASKPPKPEKILAVLNARDVVQAVWNQSTLFPPTLNRNYLN